MFNNTYKILILFQLVSFTCFGGSFKIDSKRITGRYVAPVTIVGDNLDDLVIKGVRHIKDEGERFDARAGSGQQAYDVSYVLLNPNNRLHLIRKPKSVRYFSRELVAYFNGSLDVNAGLAQASPFWKTLADKDGKIASNYGYYVFHQRISEAGNKTQYEWVIDNLVNNLDSRKAFININQPMHKIKESKDFPCTLGVQFFVKDNHLCCVVSSRSTDVYTGLPYDMGFFSFVAELVYKDLKERLPEEKSKNLKLGTVVMKANFTQIYDKTRDAALDLLNCTSNDCDDKMPAIENAQETLKDIYNQTYNTPVMQWVYKHAELSKTSITK